MLFTGVKWPNNSIKLHHWDGLVENQLGGGYFHFNIGQFKERSGSDTAEYSCLSDHTQNINIPDKARTKYSSDDLDSGCFGVNFVDNDSNLVEEIEKIHHPQPHQLKNYSRKTIETR